MPRNYSIILRISRFNEARFFRIKKKKKKAKETHSFPIERNALEGVIKLNYIKLIVSP